MQEIRTKAETYYDFEEEDMQQAEVSFEQGGSHYRATARGYFYRDGKRVSEAEFREAERERLGRVAATVAADVEDDGKKEEEMGRGNMNIVTVDGVEWARDFVNGAYYRDGEPTTRREFEEAVGVRRGGEGAPRRGRRSRDVAYERAGVTLTARQLEFVRAMATDPMGSPESGWQVDMLIDHAGINGMSAGAMVSTLREKGLVTVSSEVREDGGRPRRVRVLSLTGLGREVLPL